MMMVSLCLQTQRKSSSSGAMVLLCPGLSRLGALKVSLPLFVICRTQIRPWTWHGRMNPSGRAEGRGPSTHLRSWVKAQKKTNSNRKEGREGWKKGKRRKRGRKKPRKDQRKKWRKTEPSHGAANPEKGGHHDSSSKLVWTFSPSTVQAAGPIVCLFTKSNISPSVILGTMTRKEEIKVPPF